MKNMCLAVAAMAAMFATPAVASDVTGPRVEVFVGLADAVNAQGLDDLTYGGAIGFDVGVLDGDLVTLGLEASLDDVFDRTQIGVAARLGYQVEKGVLLYGKAGYANLDTIVPGSLDGLRLGGGVDLSLVGPLYVGAEYRYVDFEQNLGSHTGFLKAGLRF